MHKFKLSKKLTMISDQERAVADIEASLAKNEKYQVLLGVTGSGKTFSVANLIARTQKPTLIISHNKTLAGQLYQEFRDFFPDNAVSYFVSYYDFYQPEAYIPSTDTYIEKDADINELIDKLRLAATTNILTRPDTIVVASVSCIYNIGSPREYGNFILDIHEGMTIDRDKIVDRLLDLQYDRSEFGFHRGTFRVRGDTLAIYPAYQDEALEIELEGDKIKKLRLIDPVTGAEIPGSAIDGFVLFPAKHFMTDPSKNKKVFETIEEDLAKRVKEFKKDGKDLEAHRLEQKVTYELDMIKEIGYVKGIENYSRYFDGRNPGQAPFSLLDYFQEAYGDDWLVVVDESHITFPQVRGMHAGDYSRKKMLVDYGFRLPAAFDNRPLQFDEFMRRIPGFVGVSATPGDWELSMAKESGIVVEQLVRPTGIPDPKVDIRPTKHQVADVMAEVKKRKKKKQRCLISTLTKRSAEDLAEYLKEQGIDVQYIHSDVDTLDRTDILDDLRAGKYDALVGINLLREGLDLPEVSLVAILDADKEGFLRSDVTLIQTMGRAARHVEGEVILYADSVTGSMKRALSEVSRRRKYQLAYNIKHKITPKSIVKPIREKLIERDKEDNVELLEKRMGIIASLPEMDTSELTPMDKKRMAERLRREMRLAANDLNFELAIALRDKIKELKS